MGREKSVAPGYEIIAYITLNKERILSSNSLALLAKDIEEQKQMTLDIAKAMKADVTELSNGDFMVIRV